MYKVTIIMLHLYLIMLHLYLPTYSQLATGVACLGVSGYIKKHGCHPWHACAG